MQSRMLTSTRPFVFVSLPDYSSLLSWLFLMYLFHTPMLALPHHISPDIKNCTHVLVFLTALRFRYYKMSYASVSVECLFPAVLPRRRPDRSSVQEVLSPRSYLADVRQLRSCGVPRKRHQILCLPVSLNLFNMPSNNCVDYEL